MGISLGRNLAAVSAQTRLNNATSSLSCTYERLSSGLRINRASDDAAGLAVALTLNAQSQIFSQAVRNINDGISSLNVANGAAAELTGLLQRLREVAIQSVNGTFSLARRLSLDTEAYALTSEFTE